MSDALLGTIMTASVTSAIYEVVLTLTTEHLFIQSLKIKLLIFWTGYEELKLYHDTYGNLDIKAKYVSPSGFNLGKWGSPKRVLVKKHGIDATE